MDHSCDLPSREKAFFFLCSFFQKEDSSFEVSVDDLLETTHSLAIKNPQVCLQLGSSKRIRRLQIGNRLRAFNLADPYQYFNRTTCTRRHFTPEIDSPNPEVSEIKPGFDIEFFSFFFSVKLCLCPLLLAPPHEHWNLVWLCVCLQDKQYCKIC